LDIALIIEALCPLLDYFTFFSTPQSKSAYSTSALSHLKVCFFQLLVSTNQPTNRTTTTTTTTTTPPSSRPPKEEGISPLKVSALCRPGGCQAREVSYFWGSIDAESARGF